MACLTCTLLGASAGRHLSAAYATSCSAYEVWSYRLVRVEGPDDSTDGVWGAGIHLETPRGERVHAWRREPQTGFGGPSLFEGSAER